MNYTVVDSCEWTYPDITEYMTSSDKFAQLAPRSSYATAQIILWNIESDTIKIRTEGFSAELYEYIAVPVESNPGIEIAKDHFPERKAPFYINDCLKPLKDGKAAVKNGSAALYVAVFIPKHTPVGKITGNITAGDIKISVEIEVSSAVCPGETLNIVMGYNRGVINNIHGAPYGSEAFESIDTKYLKMLRRMHQNRLYIRPPHVKRIGDGKYEFSFHGMERDVKKALSLGFEQFHIYGVGFRKSWDEPTILVRGMDAMSYEAYVYLSQYLPALRQFLKSKNWTDRFCIGIADEPNEINATEYRALCGLVRKLFPEIKIYDAVSFVPIHGAIDIWVPRIDEYDKHREQIETFRGQGDEIWHYVCLFPRGDGYINRFMDLPLLATRYLYWGNYKYNLTGYLHWAVNCYQDGQNPFLQNCPRHVNAGSESILPPGDTHIIYPGDGEPWMSIRLEAQRESAEEYEMLKSVAKADKCFADKLLARCFTSFREVNFNPINFRQTRNELIRALEKIQGQD